MWGTCQPAGLNPLKYSHFWAAGGRTFAGKNFTDPNSEIKRVPLDSTKTEDFCPYDILDCSKESVLESVFVCSGCCNWITQTGRLTNRRNLPLTILEVGSSRSECQPVWVLMKAFFWTADRRLLIMFSHGRKWANSSLGLLFERREFHSGRLCSQDLVTTPRPHLLKPSYWVLGFQYMNFDSIAEFFFKDTLMPWKIQSRTGSMLQV